MKYSQILGVTLSAALFVASTGNSSAGELWRIVEMKGAAKITHQGIVPVVASNNQTVPGDSWIETAATGRVVLLRGQEVITVGPNSRLKLGALEVDGNTQILQTLGTTLYQIGKQKKTHFQVDTPYLAAIVKGTTFAVTVNQDASSVRVTDGLVQVVTPDRKDIEYVGAGFTGTVSNNHRAEILVLRKRSIAMEPHADAEPDTQFDATQADGLKLNSVTSETLIKSKLVMTNVSGKGNINANSITGALGSLVLLLTLLSALPKIFNSAMSAIKPTRRDRNRR